jgi:hypothetical protein
MALRMRVTSLIVASITGNDMTGKEATSKAEVWTVCTLVQ